MTQDDMKRAAAEAAIDYVEEGEIIGVGTGSTVNYFIDALANIKHDIEGAVSSSEASTKRLKQHGIPILDLNSAGNISVYVDGADEANKHLELIKGGGGALTREKILAGAAKKFVCIIDEGKQVGILGAFPLPIEVIQMARSFVGREIVKLGGQPVWRENVVTDNGNWILDIHNLNIMEPSKLEATLNAIPGVVTNGLFAQRPADVLLVGTENGVIKHT